MDSQPDISMFITESKIISGAENVFVELANSFAAKGLNVELVMVRWPENYGDNVYEKVLDSKVKIVYSGATRLRQSVFKIAKYIRTKKPKILISTLNYANIVCILAHLLAGRQGKLFVRLANTASVEAKHKKAKFMPQVLKFLYRLADGIISPSQGVSADLAKAYGVKNVKTIVNPIPAKLTEKTKEAVSHNWLKSKTCPVLIAGGRLCEQKNFALLIKAFAEVLKQEPAKLIIMGEGEERRQLETLSENLGIRADIDLMGQVENPFALMAKADLFVLSSIREGMPNMLLQALACGTPAVSSNCPSGPAELIVEGKNGFLTPVDDETKMAENILKALRVNWDRNKVAESVNRHKIENISNEYLKAFGVN